MFYPTWKGLLSIKCSSDLRCVDPFRRYSRSKSEVVRNRAEFWTFFALPNFRGPAFQKLYPFYHPCTSRHVAWKMFYEDTSISPEVLVAHTLNFKPNFKFPRLKFFGGTPVPVVVCASKAWSICNACKNFWGQHPPRAEMQSAEKCPLGWVNMSN